MARLFGSVNEDLTGKVVRRPALCTGPAVRAGIDRSVVAQMFSNLFRFITVEFPNRKQAERLDN